MPTRDERVEEDWEAAESPASYVDFQQTQRQTVSR
jgi:hypothetical protein